MSAPTSETSPLQVAATGHVALNVTDLARSVDFYSGVFGFDVLGRSDEPGREFAFLGRGAELILTLWQQSADEFPTAMAGLHHFAFNVPSISDVEAAQAFLRSRDVPLIFDEILAHMPGMTSGGIFFTDPDGIRIEICTAEGAQIHPTRDDGTPSCGFF